MKLDNNDLENDCPKISDVLEKNDVEDTTKLDDNQSINKETIDTNNFGSPLLVPISKKIEDESDEPIIPKLPGLYLSVSVNSLYY